jgi:pyruvate formate lyase activating enzyme
LKEETELSEALIFAVEEFSVFDGPGIRTSVFLKGCPLRCEWCHNPEGQGFENFILRSPNGCTHCGSCDRFLAENGGKMFYTDQSIAACPNNLLRYCAQKYTVQELISRLEKNFSILNASGGGITFSGGEPLSHPEFLLECLEAMEGRVHRAVQTSGYCSSDVFKRVLSRCDYMLFDIKLIDDAAHVRYTGASNAKILENLSYLAKSGKSFVIRMPLIPGVTDTEENIRLASELLLKNGIDYIELLPYNRMAGAKYSLIGEEYSPSFDTQRAVEMRKEIFERVGIKTKIL